MIGVHVGEVADEADPDVLGFGHQSGGGALPAVGEPALALTRGQSKRAVDVRAQRADVGVARFETLAQAGEFGQGEAIKLAQRRAHRFVDLYAAVGQFRAQLFDDLWICGVEHREREIALDRDAFGRGEQLIADGDRAAQFVAALQPLGVGVEVPQRQERDHDRQARRDQQQPVPDRERRELQPAKLRGQGERRHSHGALVRTVLASRRRRSCTTRLACSHRTDIDPHANAIVDARELDHAAGAREAVIIADGQHIAPREVAAHLRPACAFLGVDQQQRTRIHLGVAAHRADFDGALVDCAPGHRRQAAAERIAPIDAARRRLVALRVATACSAENCRAGPL